MFSANDFRQAYLDYAAFNKGLYDKLGPLSGILGTLGFGYKPGRDPGHEDFLQEMKAALAQVCEQQPDPETARDILDVIFHAKDTYEEEQISPFVFSAVEGFTKDLIPFLTPEMAGALYAEYKKTPFRFRTPVYKEVLAVLKKTAQA